MNEEKRPDKYLGYERVKTIYGDDGNLYWIYMKIVRENGEPHGHWAAAPHANDMSGGPDESKMFDITYAQARGFEPIAETNIGKLRRSLGKKLLPQYESCGKKRLSERKNSQPKGKESAKIREIIDILEAPRGLAKKYGYTLTPEYVDINRGGRWPITKLQYNRLKELGYGSTNELSESYEDYGVDPDETVVYFFPQLDRDDMVFARRFGLLFEEELSDEDTTAISGRFEDLVDFAENYLDYQLVDGYLFDENGDEIWLNESLRKPKRKSLKESKLFDVYRYADNYAKKAYPELWYYGLLEQEMETVYQDIEALDEPLEYLKDDIEKRIDDAASFVIDFQDESGLKESFDRSDIDELKTLIKRREEIEDKIEKHGFKDSMNLKNEYDEIRSKIKALRRKIDNGHLPRLTGMSKSDELLKESTFSPKAKKEIVDWWKEVEAWNEKKKEYNISNDYNDVEGMHSAMWDMLDELKNKDKDLYEKGRKIYNKYSDVPIKKKKVKESMNRNKKRLYKSLKESSIWGRQSAYDPEEWEQEDIELHQSIDWQGRDYMDYEVPDDKFKANVVCYRSDREPEIKGVEFHKFLRPNPIYPPCYRPAEKPFTGVIGPMFDGHKRGKYNIHDRYEDQRIYDMLSESYEDELEEGAPIITGMDGHRYVESSSKRILDSDGFMTDYTAWIDLDNFEHIIFIFGDNDLYDPSNESPDWECDSAEEAQEWFNNYTGFDDEDDEDYDDFFNNYYDESV